MDGFPTSSAAPTPLASANYSAIGPTGELFVGSYGGGFIQRYLNPLTTLTPNGTIPGVSGPELVIFVDQQLWVANSGAGNIQQFSFNAAGVVANAGVISAGLNGNLRGIAWAPTSRVAYATLCCGTNTVQPYLVAANDTVTALTPFGGNGLSNPNGDVVTPWGELFIANSGANSIVRYSLSATGVATANGTITGNSLSTPVAMAFAPWGEMYVTNQGNNTLSRFTFDANHNATANGAFATAPYAAGALTFGE